MAEYELDVLQTTFTGDSSAYEAVLAQVRASNEEFLKDLSNLRKAMQEAFTGDSNVGQVFAQSFNVARESTGQFTREYTTAMGAASQSTEAIFQDIEQLSQKMRDNHAAVREGETSREQYRKNLEAQRQQLQSLVNEYNRAARGATEYGGATSKAVSDTDDLDERIKALSNSVRTSRNEWAARIKTDEEFRQSTEALHREMWELYEAGELTGDQMRKLTQDMAYAQRGLDSVNNVASRGGLAWTAQIGISDAFGSSLRNMGPAGNAAASGLRTAQMGFAALSTPINLADLNLKKLAISLGSVVKILPLLTAAAATAAVAGLWRMANASSEMATQMEVASQRTGLNVEALQEYQYAAKQAGIEGERFNTVAQRILRRAADARAGNEGLARAFDQLGVSLTDADGNLQGIESLLGQVADGLFEVENQGERVALAFKIMDTEGSQMLNFLSAGSAGIAEMRQQARDLGLVISGDSIMSLSEFGNQVNELSRQFEVARVEIAAAFLPVLREGVIPVIQGAVVPALQEVAKKVGEFSDAFLDHTEAGVQFRADAVNSISALLQIKDVLLGLGHGFVAFSRFVGGAMAYAGALIGDLSVQVQGLGARFADLLQGLEWWERGFSLWTVRGIFRELAEGETVLVDFAAAGDSASRAASDFYASANQSAQSSANAFARVFNPGQYAQQFEEFWQNLDVVLPAAGRAGEELGETVVDGVTTATTAGGGAIVRAVADVIQQMQRDLATAAQREAHNIAVGMSGAEAEAVRLAEELGVVQSAYNALLTGDFATAPGDNLLVGLRQQAEDLQVALANLPSEVSAAVWVGRLGWEMAEGLKSPIEVIRILKPRYDELRDAQAELLQASEFDSAAWDELTGKIQTVGGLLEGAVAVLPTLSFPRPDEGEGLSEIAAAAAAARHEALLLAVAQDELARSYDTSTGSLEEFNRAWQAQQDAAAQAQGYRDVVLAMREIDEATMAAARSAERWQLVMHGQRFSPLAPDEGEGGEFSAVYQRLREELAKAEAQALAFGDAVDLNALKTSAYQTAINSLLDEGVSPLSTGVQWLLGHFAELTGEADAAALALLRTEAAAQAAEQATGAYDTLLAALEGIGRTVDPIDAQRQALRDLAATGLLTSEQVIAAIKAEGAARQRLADDVAEQSAEAFAALRAEITALNAAPDPFANMAKRIQAAGEELNWTTEQVEELLDSLADAERDSKFDEFIAGLADELDTLTGEAKDWLGAGRDMSSLFRQLRANAVVLGVSIDDINLLEMLHDSIELNDALRNLSGTVDGMGGELLGIAADMQAAIVTFAAGGDAIDLVTASFNAATAAVEMFKDGLSGEDILDLLTGIGTGIATAIGGEQLGKAFAATMGFIKSILGDLSNGIKEVNKQIEEMASRASNLTQETVQALTQPRVGRVSRGGLLGAFGLTKAGLTEEMQELVKHLVSVADSAGGLIESALKGTDPFGDVELGVDKLIQAELIRGFVMSPEVQAAIVALTEAVNAQDWDLARDIGADIARLTEEQQALLAEHLPELYGDAGALAGGAFAGAFENALKGVDFAADFTRGLEETLRDNMIRDFFDQEGVQEAMAAAQEAFAAGNEAEGRAIMEGLAAAGEAFWEQLKQQFPDLYEGLRAEELARALQGSADAVARLGLEVRQSELARAFEQGVLGLAAYRNGLVETARAEADLAREQAQRDLAERRRAALAGLEGEDYRRLSDQFAAEAAAIDARARESILEAERAAADSIKNLLGLATSGLAGSLAQAFDAASYGDFVTGFGDSMHDTIRNALKAGFLEGEVMKPMLEQLGTMISDAVVDGVWDATTKAAIGAQIDLVTETAGEFWQWMEDLGFGFKDLTRDTERLTESVASVSQSLLNVPSLFKFASATWSAAPVQPGWAGGGFAGAQQSVTNEQHFHVNVTADTVIGIDDLDEHIEETVRTSVNQSTLATTGLGMGRRGDW